MAKETPRPITLLIAAMGGEGGGVLTSWIVSAARKAGYPVQATSITGVAQRTGATTYYIELIPATYGEIQDREPLRYPELFHERLTTLAHALGNAGEVAFLPKGFVRIH